MKTFFMNMLGMLDELSIYHEAIFTSNNASKVSTGIHTL